MDFIEERLLDKVSYGSEFGSMYNTRIKTLRSGRDKRNANWSMPLRKAALLYQIIEPDDHALIVDAHAACMGSLFGFRMKDWSDYQAKEELLGVAAGGTETMQLRKEYKFGTQSVYRTISKPINTGFQLYNNGTPISFVLDITTGEVEFTASTGDAITWSGEFDVPVRFESDRLDVQPIILRDGGYYALTANVNLTEIRI